MLMETVLEMAGYRGDAVPAMHKRMIDAMETIPGVESVGLVAPPPLASGGWNESTVFTDETTDLRPSNAAASAVMSAISPEYFHAAGTALLSGRPFTWHDDKNAPRVAVINKEFARKIFGSVTNAIGRHYKMPDGMRIQVVGIVEDGKYKTLTEDPQPAMFFPILQSPSSGTWTVVRSNRDPQQLAAAMRSTLRKLRASVGFTYGYRQCCLSGNVGGRRRSGRGGAWLLSKIVRRRGKGQSNDERTNQTALSSVNAEPFAHFWRGRSWCDAALWFAAHEVAAALVLWYRGKRHRRRFLKRRLRHNDPGDEITHNAPADKKGHDDPDQTHQSWVHVQVFRETTAHTGDLFVGPGKSELLRGTVGSLQLQGRATLAAVVY